MRRTSKFLLVALLNTGVDIGVLNILLVTTTAPVSTSLFAGFKGLAFLAAVTNSYFLNSIWVFKDVSHQRNWLHYGHFLRVNCQALVVNLSVAALVFYIISLTHSNNTYTANFAAICGSLSGLLINFKGYQKIFK